MNTSEKATFNLWDTAKIMRGKFIGPNAYITNEETSQITNLNFQLKKLEKEGKTKLRARGKRERIGFIGQLETIIYSALLQLKNITKLYHLQ